MKKKSRTFWLGMAAFTLSFMVLLAGCDNGSTDNPDPGPDTSTVKYTVTFDGNGSDGGSVPAAITQASAGGGHYPARKYGQSD